MIESSGQVSAQRAIVIVPEGLGADFFSPPTLPGFTLEQTCRVDNQDIAESGMVLLVAPEKGFFLQTVKQIRSHPKTALTPLIAACEQDGLGEFQQLIDLVLPFPVDNSAIQQGFSKLLPLTHKIGQFPSPPSGLGEREERWLNLLRFLSSRSILKLTPQWDTSAPQGYGYPLVSAILGTQPGEEVSQLELLSQMSLLEGRFYDKIHLCPQCRRFQLNFREVCPACRKSNICLEENLHHYACSYIAPRREFRQAGSLVCPKCRQLLGTLGVDYDQPSSGHHCPACRQSFSEALVDCLCLSCGNAFPPDNARLQTVWEYQLTSPAWQAAQTGLVSPDRLKDFLYQQLGFLDYELFKKLLELQTDINQRFPHPLHLIKLRIKNCPDQTSGEACLYQFWGKLMGDLRNNLRSIDLVTWLGGEEILIISIGTKPKQLRRAILRLQKNITADWPGINLQSWFVPLLPEQNWELVLQELTGGRVGYAHQPQKVGAQPTLHLMLDNE